MGEITYGYWLPWDASTHGAAIDRMMVAVHILMFTLFIGWGIFFVYCLAKFRAKPGRKALYQPVKGSISKYAEIGVVIFEAVLLVGFSMPVWARYKNDFPAEKDAVVVKITAEQFAWNIHYPGPDGKFGRTSIDLIDPANPIGLDRDDPAAKDDAVSRNDFHVPVGKPVIVRLTSKDVIHSFFIPVLRVKQDAIPGTEIPVWFEVRKDALDELRESQVAKTGRVLEALKGDAGAGQAVEKLAALVEKLKAKGDYPQAEAAAAIAAIDALGKEHKDDARYADMSRTLVEMNEFDLACAQLCGVGHTTMRSGVKIDTPGDFEKWLASKQRKR